MNLAAFILAWVAGIAGIMYKSWVVILLSVAIILMLWTTVVN